MIPQFTFIPVSLSQSTHVALYWFTWYPDIPCRTCAKGFFRSLPRGPKLMPKIFSVTSIKILCSLAWYQCKKSFWHKFILVHQVMVKSQSHTGMELAPGRVLSFKHSLASHAEIYVQSFIKLCSPPQDWGGCKWFHDWRGFLVVIITGILSQMTVL